MPNQNVGDTLWIEATITDDKGSAFIPDSHQVTLTGPRCNTTISDVTHISGARFKALIQIPITGGRGLYTLTWVVKKDGLQETEKYNFVVH